MSFPDAWLETALVSISAAGGSDIEFASATTSIDIDQGDKEIEGMPNLKGGRIEKWTPETDTTITFEGYFVELDTASNTGIQQLFNTTRASWDVSEPLAVNNSLKRDNFRVAILWTNDAAATTGFGATAASTDSLRFYIQRARLISAKTSFTDGILKTTFKFKCPAFKKDGTSNVTWQSGDQTALVTLGSYT